MEVARIVSQGAGLATQRCATDSDKHALFAAIEKRDAAAIRNLLRTFPELIHATRQRDGARPVMLVALRLGDVDLVRRMFRADTDRSYTDREGLTLAHYAAGAQHGDPCELMQYLIGVQGLSPHAVDRAGMSVLSNAVHHGHIGTVTYLLNVGADVNARQKVGSRKADADGVERIDNADVDEWYAGSTALHYAVRHSTPEMARLLLKRGADCTITDGDGKRPDFYADSGAMRALFDL